MKHLRGNKRETPLVFQPARVTNLLALGIALTMMLGCSEPELKEYGTVAPFSLVKHTGDTFESNEMSGQVWVVSFFFTRCRTICPPLLKHLGSVLESAKQSQIPLRVASISVDPEYDTPKRLTEKHDEIQAPEEWSFLTGTPEQVRKVVVEGFKTHMGEQEIMEDGLIEIGHGAKLMLIDKEGVIRGLFGTEDKDIGSLVALAKRLHNQGD